ncbi:hypothetical protein GCM10010170_093520 [Dactylosporangium salmoneum]|uniref:Uncharacterized protein n=1 Tax=Dactylosporangium salmoneum TaxID=53361 RepID=A0ABN3HN01_9ACTN
MPPETVSENVAVWVTEVPVPVTVRVYVPAVADDDTEIDRVAEPPEVTDAVTPVGAPVTDRFTVCALPDVVAVATDAVVELPGATVAEDGDSDTEKSGPFGLLLVTVTV